MSITNAARRFEQRFDAKAERFIWHPQAADPSLSVCGTACDSAKPPKTQFVQGLNGCYFIEDVTKKCRNPKISAL